MWHGNWTSSQCGCATSSVIGRKHSYTSVNTFFRNPNFRNTSFRNWVRFFETRIFETRIFETRIFETRLFEIRIFETRIFKTWIFETRLFETRIFETRIFETRIFETWLFEIRFFETGYDFPKLNYQKSLQLFFRFILRGVKPISISRFLTYKLRHTFISCPHHSNEGLQWPWEWLLSISEIKNFLPTFISGECPKAHFLMNWISHIVTEPILKILPWGEGVRKFTEY